MRQGPMFNVIGGSENVFRDCVAYDTGNPDDAKDVLRKVIGLIDAGDTEAASRLGKAFIGASLLPPREP